MHVNRRPICKFLFVNAGTTNHWLVVYQHSLLKPDIELTPVDDKQRAEMQLLEKRFRDMIYTKGKTTDKEVETIRKKYDFYQITYKNTKVSGSTYLHGTCFRNL